MAAIHWIMFSVFESNSRFTCRFCQIVCDKAASPSDYVNLQWMVDTHVGWFVPGTQIALIGVAGNRPVKVL